METSTPQPAALSPELCHQLVHTLTALLPPPPDDSPGALRARNNAAIAKVAAMLPVNANEADLAAQCIAARGQAEDVLRLIREHAHDIALTTRLNAQYASMVRTSASVHGRLMRVQAVRRKREAIEGAADQGAWTRHVAERSMLKVADPDFERATAASPGAALASRGEQQIAENVSYYDTNSHNVAFETRMSAHCVNRPEATTSVGSRLAGQHVSADGRASPGGTGADPSEPEKKSNLKMNAH